MFKTYIKNYTRASIVLSRSFMPIHSFNKRVFSNTVNIKNPKKRNIK